MARQPVTATPCRPFHKPGAGAVACLRCRRSRRIHGLAGRVRSSERRRHDAYAAPRRRRARAIRAAVPSPARAAVPDRANAALPELVLSGSGRSFAGCAELGAELAPGWATTGSRSASRRSSDAGGRGTSAEIVQLISLVERRSRVCSLEKAEVWLEHNHRDRRYRIAWRTERLAASAELTLRSVRCTSLKWSPQNGSTSHEASAAGGCEIRLGGRELMLSATTAGPAPPRKDQRPATHAQSLRQILPERERSQRFGCVALELRSQTPTVFPALRTARRTGPLPPLAGTFGR